MRLIRILKELWGRPVPVVLSVVAAAAIAVLAVYQVSFMPPSISKRTQVSAQGSVEILVDSARSPIADARRDLTGLMARAGVFARLIAGGNVVGEIAKKTGIPVKQIDVAGPTPLPGEAPGIEEPPPQLHPYGISIAQQGELPIVTVTTRAPTVPEARALAAAAPAAVSRMVESIQTQQSTPAEKQVELRVLGPAKAAPVDDALGKKVALVLFIVVLAMGLTLILAGPRLVAAWRTAEPEELQWDRGEDEPGESSSVLHLPTSRDGESAAEGARR